MRLDPDLIRQILLVIENPPANRAPGNIQIPDRSADEVMEHLELMREDGLIEARVLGSGMGGARLAAIHVERMTSTGHEFLDNARDNTRWNRAKDIVLSKGGAVSLEILKMVLIQVAKSTFHLPS